MKGRRIHFFPGAPVQGCPGERRTGPHREILRNRDGSPASRRFRRILCALVALCLTTAVLPCISEAADLKTLQKRLLNLGYEVGEADGIYGTKTSSAVLLVQTLLADSGYDLLPTGDLDDFTAELIMEEENGDLLRTLLKGSWGSRVREAQRKLIGMNLLQDSADGQFGSNTETAVFAFEDMLTEAEPDTIKRDGRLSAEEYALLMSDLSAYGIEGPEWFDDGHPENLKGSFLYARNACLINAVTGETLLEKAADEPAEPASTTKIMTLLTALGLCDPDQEIVIPEAAADIPVDSTVVPVYPGEKMTMRDLLYAMIIRSGNDAANAVAVLCAGSTEAFADRMNLTAETLGMKNSHFVNPHGYTSEGHYTTARDLVTAATFGMTQTLFREIVTCSRYTLPATELREPLVISLKWELFDPDSEYYIPHAAGIKSGYTSSAGFCYVGAYQDQGVTLIAAVMGGRGRYMAWTDLKRLFAYGMAVSK